MNVRPFRLERFLGPREFKAAYVLCGSDCETMRVADLLALEDGASDAFLDLELGYTTLAGGHGLRAAIAATYSSIVPDDVLVHSAGEEAVFTFMHAALKRGDHVVVHHPSYQSLSEIPRAIGCNVTRWAARPDRQWKPDLDALRDSLRSDTRLIVVNTPHNPTGFLWTHQEWEALFDIARARDVRVLSDEAYRGLEYDESDRLPAACDVYENACSIGMTSKGYGLPGLRIGWAATHDAALRDRMSHIRDYTTICSSGPSEFLAELALRHGEELLARARDIIRPNLALLASFFAEHGDRLQWVPPRSGPVTFPVLVDGDVDSFCERVLEATGVLLLPGTVFCEGSRSFRIGMGRRSMPEALRRLDEFLRS